MKTFFFLTFLLTLTLQASPKPIARNSVAILYNSNIAESKQLAEYYAEQRGIPHNNLIGLALSKANTINRLEYQNTLEQPLRDTFSKNLWWTLRKDQEGRSISVRNNIKLLVCMRGVPYGIQRSNDPAHGSKNEASVDSELSVIGVSGLPIQNFTNNPYFKKDLPFSESKLEHALLVGRIDGPSYQTCRRMIDDAIATEKTGLWGMCYLDLSKKGAGYKVGDDWINNIETQNWNEGLPTTKDNNLQTYLTNYPFEDPSLYYGWYTPNINGPFLNPNLKFQRGAIAIHLHSFSAQALRSDKKRWCGALLERGAAATVGNVYEPYLQYTHQFDILHDRLLKGYSLVEAAYMAHPTLSWQGVVLGDPLYRPFLHFDTGKGIIEDLDRPYRAARTAWQRWKNEPDTLSKKLRAAGAKTNNARYYEILGLHQRYQGDLQNAVIIFTSAVNLYYNPASRLRIRLHIVDMYREIGKKEKAILLLQEIINHSQGLPELSAAKALMNILNPPPPAIVQPQKSPTP